MVVCINQFTMTVFRRLMPLINSVCRRRGESLYPPVSDFYCLLISIITQKRESLMRSEGFQSPCNSYCRLRADEGICHKLIQTYTEKKCPMPRISLSILNYNLFKPKTCSTSILNFLLDLAGSRGADADLFSELTSDGSWENRMELGQGMFGLDIRKGFSPRG